MTPEDKFHGLRGTYERFLLRNVRVTCARLTLELDELRRHQRSVRERTKRYVIKDVGANPYPSSVYAMRNVSVRERTKRYAVKDPNVGTNPYPSGVYALQSVRLGIYLGDK